LKKENILSYFVLLFSIANIYRNQTDLYTVSIALSFIGIIAFIMSLFKIRPYQYIFFIWIIAQFVIIDVTEMVNGININNHILDLSQGFNLKIGFFATYTPKTYSVNLNLLPFIFLPLYRLLTSRSVINNKISIFPVSEQSPITNFSPLNALIISNESNKTFVAELDKEIQIDQISYKTVKFETADKSIFKLKRNRQKCIVKLFSIEDKNEIETQAFIK
jgi:hypothetical protein